MFECDSAAEYRQVQFYIEQLKLVSKGKTSRHYSPELLLFAYVLFSVSCGCYERLLEQEVLVLPSVKTLRRISKKVGGNNGLNNEEYLAMRLSKLSGFDLNVILMIDEIYLAKRTEMSGGNVCGLMEDGTMASTALCFMIRSLSSKYRDIVSIYPIKTLKAETLFTCYQEVLQTLVTIGFNVVAILVDNYSANRKFFLHHLCEGVWRSYVENYLNGRKIFLIFDPTHNIKNLYNNFQCRKLFGCPACEPILTKPTKANFQDVEKVFELESRKPLKMGHKLNTSVISPKSIEKTSTKLALAVFNESTINALKLYGFNDTATIVAIFTKLWNVLNVKTTNIGKQEGHNSRSGETYSGLEIGLLVGICSFSGYVGILKSK